MALLANVLFVKKSNKKVRFLSRGSLHEHVVNRIEFPLRICTDTFFIKGEASSLSTGGMVDCDLVANLQSVGGGRGPPARSIKGTLHYIFEPACNNSGESGRQEGI